MENKFQGNTTICFPHLPQTLRVEPLYVGGEYLGVYVADPSSLTLYNTGDPDRDTRDAAARAVHLERTSKYLVWHEEDDEQIRMALRDRGLLASVEVVVEADIPVELEEADDGITTADLLLDVYPDEVEYQDTPFFDD